ncbi:MAG: hypothetical protein ABIQ80_10270 [Fibrobacteria bacterium]
MENVFTRWMQNRKLGPKTATLDDVAPMHPDEYPGQHLRERLAARRDRLTEIDHRGHPTGMPEGPDGF